MKPSHPFLRHFTALALAAGLTSGAHAQLGRQQGLIDPNVATEKELLGLPHLTAELAREVMAQRPFLSVTGFHAVVGKSLNKEQTTELYRKAFVHLNLNTATRGEMMLIPAFGGKMAHEFEEYRPYRSLAQFRKEIGKYVNEQELARLEQYVFVPIDLNTASDADISSIPGLGRKMLHEFKEYRPYKSIEQFRKEIGKYVGPKELARLERYVALK
jgi:DNA uptake protein ComE-like DNA-binding protein